jgi:sulfide:quinone oxidoreductase
MSSGDSDPSSSPLSPSSEQFEVVIAGGGVAGVEAALALRDMARERVALTIIAPNADFVYRPTAVLEPFRYGETQRYPLAKIARDMGAQLVKDSFVWVDTTARVAHTEMGGQFSYDALLLALGARAQAPYEHALTIDDRRMDEIVHGLIMGVEGGYVKSLALVIPGRIAWPLPVYELALMTAARACEMRMSLEVTIVTPEESPLGIFGIGASAAVSDLLREAGIAAVTSASAEVPSSGRVLISPGDRQIEADRIVALPEVFGPAVRGLPVSDHGFIPVDLHCQVRATDRVYAAGDATDFAVKQGGIASQQADAAAEAIAALAGADIAPQPFEAVIRGTLLTGGAPKFLSARIADGKGIDSEVADEPSWSPPGKIASKYLAPYLSLAPGADHESPAFVESWFSKLKKRLI